MKSTELPPIEPRLSSSDVVHGNEHHNVPQSRRGSNNEGNLSYVAIERHARYHDWTFNMLPNEAIRFVAIESTTHPNPDRRLDPRQLHDVLLKARGHELYWDKAFIPGNHPNLAVRMVQDLHHSTRHLSAERARVAHAMSYIEGETRDLPDYFYDTFDGARKFFDVRSAAESIEGILTEKQNRELAWCKTLKYTVQKDILKVLDERRTDTWKPSECLWALQEHLQVLDTRLRLIAESVQNVRANMQLLEEGLRIFDETA